jgi:hypothetical protein
MSLAASTTGQTCIIYVYKSMCWCVAGLGHSQSWFVQLDHPTRQHHFKQNTTAATPSAVVPPATATNQQQQQQQQQAV